MDRDESGHYRVAYEANSERTYGALEKLSKLFNAEYAYFWNKTGSEALAFREGRSLLSLMETKRMTDLRDIDFRFGVLPYPMYDAQQDGYKSLNWSGIMMIPSSIRNPEMVGDVLELLAYYSEPVKVAYYENLLGSKLADAPEDAEMLDVIWDSVTSDVGMVTANLDGMNDLLYMFPNLCKESINRYSSFVKRNASRANRALEELFGE